MPSNNQEFALYCCDLLAGAGPCVARRMFGGWGISTAGLTIALMTDLGQGDTLWLKADESSIAQFEAAGCPRFIYAMKDGVPKGMNYYAAPDEAMESPALMLPWARLALQAAVAAAAGKAARAVRQKAAPVKAAKAANPAKAGKPTAPTKAAKAVTATRSTRSPAPSKTRK